MNKELGAKLQKYMMLSYLYYIRNRTVVSDEEYDQLAKDLLAGYDNFEHEHKKFVTKEDLEAGTLYHLKADAYPLRVVGAALLWLTDYERLAMNARL
jgi:hypothetical protein